MKTFKIYSLEVFFFFCGTAGGFGIVTAVAQVQYWTGNFHMVRVQPEREGKRFTLLVTFKYAIGC